MTTSSPCSRATDRSTALVPVVTLGTNTRSSARAPRKAATGAAASRRRDSLSPWRRVLAGELAQHEARRLPLDLVAERLLLLQHARRRSAHGAVIEVREIRIEQPFCEHRAAELRHGWNCIEIAHAVG